MKNLNCLIKKKEVAKVKKQKVAKKKVSVFPREGVAGSKNMFSSSSVILFSMRGVDSCVFLIFTTRVVPK
jgi:hypothetical protein